MTKRSLSELVLECVGLRIALRFDCSTAFDFFNKNFAALRCNAEDPIQLEYVIRTEADGYCLDRPGNRAPVRALDLGALVYEVESDIVIRLQLGRPDLLFLHAAVISNEHSSCIVTGPSGAGKSTTCWGMLHHGFRYTSDELAPIETSNVRIHPYIHALCLKSYPPCEYRLPNGAVRTERGYHIPVNDLPSLIQPEPPLARFLVFVQYDATLTAPEIKEIDSAEAAARLYPNLLNALAHTRDGLTPLARLVTQLKCMQVRSAGLRATCLALADRLA